MANTSVCPSCIRALRRQFHDTQHTRRRVRGSPLTPRILDRSSNRLLTQLRPFSVCVSSRQNVEPISYRTPARPPGKSSAVKVSEPKAKPAESTAPAPVATLAQNLRERAPSFTETYVAYGTCGILLKECARVADYNIPEEQRRNMEIPDAGRGTDVGVGSGWWYDEMKIQPSFNNWAQITFLHMWLLTVRFRTFPKAHAGAWHQHLTDHFFYLAEDKMATLHGLAARSVRNRHLKDLFVQWRGATAGYDEGLVRGDAVLAAAVWRNVCGAAEDPNVVAIAQVVAYARSVLHGLDAMSDEDIANGSVVFEDPGQEAALVALKSRLMDEPASTDGRAAESAVEGGSESRGAGASVNTAAKPVLEGVPPKKWMKAPQGTVVKVAA